MRLPDNGLWFVMVEVLVDVLPDNGLWFVMVEVTNGASDALVLRPYYVV